MNYKKISKYLIVNVEQIGSILILDRTENTFGVKKAKQVLFIEKKKKSNYYGFVNGPWIQGFTHTKCWERSVCYKFTN